MSTGQWWDTSELEFSEETVVATLSTLTLIDGESDGGLVVFNGCENSLFDGWDLGVTGNDDTENVTLHGNTKGERSDIKEEKVSGLVRGLAGKDGSLDGGTVSNSLIGVDGLVEGTATEELADEGLDLGDTGRTTDEDDIIDLCNSSFRDALDG